MSAQQPKVLPVPVDWEEMFPGRFMKAADFKGAKVTLTIASVKIEELIGDKGPQIKGIISFDRTEKSLAINKTNGICFKEMFGKKVQEWIGRRVTLFPGTHDGEPCIRVWGSPDLPADRDITIALPRKRPFTMTMHKVTKSGSASGTGKGTTPPPSPASEPPATEREPGSDDEPGYDAESSLAIDRQLAGE